jgi:transcriptional regulator with XRE-family HTH domain
MFEPLAEVIRLRRLQRNLTQERLAKMAGVSRRQLSLLEDGRNVSLLFLTKIARALELTELPVGELRVRASQPELATIVRAADVLERMKQGIPEWTAFTEQILEAIASLDRLMDGPLTSTASSRDVDDDADRLAVTPPSERVAAGEALRSLARAEPDVRAPRPKSSTPPAARRRNR